MKRWSESTTSPIADILTAIARMRQLPVCRPPALRASFYFAWSRRWAAHRLSTALGYPSKEPVIR